MAGQLLVAVLIFLVSVGLAIPLGKYMARVYDGRKMALDFLAPLEKALFRLCRIDPTQPMSWVRYAATLLLINLIWFAWGFVLLLTQSSHPFWNPAGITSMEWTLAFNSAVSFLTSTNLQHYSGETGASYFSQLLVFTFLQFVSAATSLAAGIAVIRGIRATTGRNLGNFYRDFLLSVTRILLPLSLVVGALLIFNDVPMTFRGPEAIVNLPGDSVTIARGPVAAMIPIKHLGSNGGGFFGPNTAHPFENPNFATYTLELITVYLLPMAFVIMFGYYLHRKRFAIMIFSVMTAFYIGLSVPLIQQELHGNELIAQLGIDQSAGNLEGKEVRFGTFYSAFWCGVNIAIPAGTLTSMHDSYTPLSGLFMLVGMQIDAFYGGLGTGFLYMFIYIILATFVGSLMIGRTPELLNKKLEANEMKIAVLVIVIQPLLYLVATAVSSALAAAPDAATQLQWLKNPGYHGFTTMLYEFVSSAAGNGSGFEGLGDNTPFWNLSTALVMLLGRFVPMIGPIAIAGMLQAKPFVPESLGTLRTDNVTFGVMLSVVIAIIGALCFFPAIALGPLAEYFTLP